MNFEHEHDNDRTLSPHPQYQGQRPVGPRRTPSTPIPPSASTFLDQNRFVTPPPNRQPDYYNIHTFPPRRYPQPPLPRFPLPQSFPQLPPNPYDYNYYTHYPQHHHQAHQYYPPPFIPPVPEPTHVSHSKSLPTVSHIPLLSGRSDFAAWNNGVRSLVLHLGYAGHITNPPNPGVTPRPDRLPTYPPPLSQMPSPLELAASRIWWEHDNVVSHILTTRLSPTVLSVLPYDDDDETATPRTARTVYELLRKLYSVHDHTSSSALYTDLCNLQCGGRVQDYIIRWRAGITQLRAAKFVISFRIVIEKFLDRLPTSVPYQILRYRIMDTIDTIGVDDVAAFLQITDDALNIDHIHRRTTQPLHRASPLPLAPRIPPAVAATTFRPPTPVPLTAPTSSRAGRPPRSSLICVNTNCNGIGHLIDTCFKPGGGLEGKRDQYMASLGRVQAHLTHLTDILDGNPLDDAVPLVVEETAIVDDPTDPIPTIAALSLSSEPPVVASIPEANTHFYFED